MASTKKLSVENALREVQRLIREHDPRGDELPIGTRNVDVPGTEPPKVSYSFFADESEAVDRAAAALREDLRFEHLDDPGKSAWEFADEAFVHEKGDRVPKFVTEHAREVLDRRCYLLIEYLKLTAPIELGRVRLLPVSESELPKAQPPWFLLDPPVGAVAVVEVSGTNGHRMADRARAEVRFELRKLRLGMRGMNLYHERQLRFRLNGSFTFDQGGQGWNRPDDSRFEAGLLPESLEKMKSEELFSLTAPPVTDLDKCAHRAAEWIERALLVNDSPLNALLYLFFALEALLGDRGEGLKGHGLAARLAMLNHVTESGFTHPNVTLFLYDQVRSSAAHGGDPPEVDWRTVSQLTWDVRDALNRYLRLAAREGLYRRGRLIQHLERHPDWPKLREWLLEQDAVNWSNYFDVFEAVTPVIPVVNLVAALERYRRLGFEVRAYRHDTGYGYADRGKVSLLLSEWDQQDPTRTGSVVYIHVSDADAVRAEWTASGVEGRFGEVQETEYEMREFAYVDPDGTLHRVGSRLDKS